MLPPTRCPRCNEKLICTFRLIEDNVMIAEEMECPERHYTYTFPEPSFEDRWKSLLTNFPLMCAGGGELGHRE